ncbi:MAG: LamG-like jellyroll fold domain-containing protein [Fluviicola sp.]
MKRVILPLIAFAFHLNASAQVPIDNVLLYMPFNGNANDESGNGNNGTVDGASLTSDRFGNLNSAYYFDGLDDRIDISNNNLVPDNSLTLSFWFAAADNLNSLSDPQVMIQSDIAGDIDGHFLIGFNRTNCLYEPSTEDGKVNFELQGDLANANTGTCNGNNFGLTSVGSITDSWDASSWNMVTAVVNEGQIKIYINGQLQDTHPCTSSVFTNGLDVTLGIYDSWQPLTPFKGGLDDIRFYSRVLTDQEIGALYNEFVNVDELSSIPFTIYPNPTNDVVTIKGDAIAGSSVKIVNAQGQIALEAILDSNSGQLDLNNIPSEGIYFLQIFNDAEELLGVEKLIVK